MRARPLSALPATALAVALGACQPGMAARGETVTVERVVDGDTVVIARPDGGRERVRMIGVDAPESVKRGAPVECYGPEREDLALSWLDA